ncbi:MAG: succinylglutamate desuccinylase/aspartoacylase family protein, partial [Candidatus Nanohalobium sp.]
MKTTVRGSGEPEIVVVGSVHGDEPAGKNAVEKVLEEESEFRRPVKFIIANEKALEEGERFIDRDLNSSFPGDPDSSRYEDRLAAEITEEVKGKTVIDLHSTRST